jgi:UDP-N-acetylglucosamine--N-acetylmuramyl-(pentapeptide) pyrophosphoryl-undecaprenol N-acetylglucosamine transferase
MIILAAGGTGGHLFPAESLARALALKGVPVQLVTDERAAHYGADFPAEETHLIHSATFASKNPIAIVKTCFTLLKGIFEARAIMKEERPLAVIGFGGYPTFPPLIAALTLGIPTLIHEQNAVLGRANKALSRFVKVIATGFPGALDGHAKLKAKAVFTGNPLRPMVLEAAKVAYTHPDDSFNLLVFGGSQGASVMRHVVPEALSLLPQIHQARLRVIQQARDEDLIAVTKAYEAMGISHTVSPFFTDLPNMIAHSHLIIARSGASTVAELAAIGRASILVPLPHALDNDQGVNAGILASSLAAVVMKQSEFTPANLSQLLAHLMDDPAPLFTMSENAKACGTLNAAETLAELVLSVAKRA